MLLLCLNREYSADRLEREIVEPLRRKFPGLTLDYSIQDPFQENEASAALSPDLYFMEAYSNHRILNQGRFADLNKLSLLAAHQDKVAKEAFDEGLLMRGISGDGQWFAVPYSSRMEYPLVYNKDIFDRFGVPYPKDDMTWDEVIELAGQVTGECGGNHYYGLDVADLALLESQLGARCIDPATGRSAVMSESWRRLAETIKRIYAIEGNLFPNRQHALRLNRYFVRDRNIAMSFICLSCYHPTDLNFNWDMVTFPVFEQRRAPNLRGSLLAVGSGSERQSEAYQMLAYLVSEEKQSENSRNGIVTALTSPLVRSCFGEHVPLFQDKNRRAMFGHPAVMPRYSADSGMDDLLQELYVNNEPSKVMARWKLLEMIYDGKTAEKVLAELDANLNEALASLERKEQ